MNLFEFQQQATVEHVNVRRGNNDETPVAVDIKLKVEDVATKVAAAILRADKAEVLKAFFADDDDQNKRFLGVEDIPVKEEWEGKHQIKISSLARMRCAKVFKVRLTPRAKGLFDMTMTATVEDPPENYLDAIADKIHRSVAVKLEQDQRELELEQKPQDDGKKPGNVNKIQGEQGQLVN